MVSKYGHVSESWPHHVDKHGRMVPCASNPCKLHSSKGTDLIVTGGPDEAQRIYDYMNVLIASINDALKSIHMIMNDELKNHLLAEMRTCYNSNHDFDYFMNKYGIAHNKNVNNNINILHNDNFKKLMSQFNITRQKVSLKRAASSHTVKNTSENNNDDLMNHAINKNKNEYYNLRRNNNYSNHIGMKTGTYYIECSPVNYEDNSLKRAVRMKNFMMLAVSMGFAKVSNANMIDSSFRREGTILEFSVRNDEDFRYLIRKAQELANDFDDGNGFIVYRNQNNKMGHDYVTTFNADSNSINAIINNYNINVKLKGYEYKNITGKYKTIVTYEENEQSYNFIKTIIPHYDIKTDVHIIRKK